MWESSTSSTDSDNNGPGEFVDSPSGSLYYGIEQFCNHAGVRPENLVTYFGDDYQTNVSLMLKNSRNCEKGKSLLLAIPVDEISVLSAARFKFAFRHSERAIQLYEALQSYFKLLGTIDERQYKFVIRQSNEIAKLVASDDTTLKIQSH